jgi:outer membrane receptor for ferrienterochelin and colicins
MGEEDGMEEDVREEDLYEDIFLEIEGITVTGTRTEKRLSDSPVVTEIISAAEIENSSASTVSEVLNDYGLMYTSNAMGDYIQMQGMGEGRILFLVDGRRLVGRVAQRLNGETMPLGNVERIEIVRGPQSALYGSDGIGGVINIITKKPEDKISLSAGISNGFMMAYDDPETSAKPEPFDDFNPFREQNLTVSFGFPLGITRNSLNIDVSRGDFYYAEGKSRSILPAYYRGKAGLDSFIPLGDSAELRAGGSFMPMRSDEQTNSRGSLIRSDYIRADGYIEAALVPFSRAMLTLRLYDNYYQRDKDTYSALIDEWITGESHENENLIALEAQGEYDGIENWLFTAGLEGAYNSMDKYNLHNDGTFAGVDKEALFIQAERFREEVYSVLGGLRIERNSQFGFAAAPKISSMYHLPHGFRLLAGTGLGYRAPDFNDLYLVKDDTITPGHPLVKGNPDLQPEYALGFNMALEYTRQDLFFGQINMYYSELFNEIAYIDQHEVERGMEVYKTGNISRSLRTGTDAEGRLTIFKYGFFSAGYSWLFAYDRTLGEELHLQPAHTVKMKLGLDHKDSGINTWLGGRFFSPLYPDDSSYESRFILDFYFSINLGTHFKVYTAINNLTGEIDSLGPATAQSLTLGLKYFL